MKIKRMSIDEKLQLIMECRNIGLTDYQWCKRHDNNPSTFYNWINRLHRKGNVIPETLPDGKKPQFNQEIVKLELVHEHASLSAKVNETIKFFENQTSNVHPAAEIVLENATLRFFYEIDQVHWYNLIKDSIKMVSIMHFRLA